MLFKYLAVALAPLIVSAVKFRRANLDAGTVLAVSEYFRCPHQIWGLWTFLRIRRRSRADEGEALPGRSGEIYSSRFHRRWLLVWALY